MASRRPRLPLAALLVNCLFLVACSSAGASGDQAAAPPPPPASPATAGPIGAFCPPRYLPDMPKDLSLCGEKVPLHDQLTAEALDREFTIAVHDQAQVVMWLKRAQRYFPYISARLKAAGLPDDLKYLAVAESSLIQRVVSTAGAVGPWQFIESTGRHYGLRRDSYFDDRRNPERATDAALHYLRDLYKDFGSWTLAMASYNCGERRVRLEMEEQGVRSYYDLYLPYETMRYVFRVLAAKIILENPTAYGYCLPDDALYKPLPADRARLDLHRALHLRTLAQATNTTVRMLKELNPELTTYIVPRGVHDLKVPAGQAKGLSQRLAAARPEAEPAPPPPPRAQNPLKKAQAARAAPRGEWTVKPGDSLSGIAHKLGVSVAALRQANNIEGNKIKPGQKLLVPLK